MARKSAPPPSRVLNQKELEEAIESSISGSPTSAPPDVAAIHERWDARVEALETRVSSTLAEIFGEDTPDYHRYYVGDFDSLPISMMSNRFSQCEIQDSIRAGIEGAVVKLSSVRDLLAERLEDAAVVAHSEPSRAARAPGNPSFVVHGRDDAAKGSVTVHTPLRKTASMMICMA